MADVTRVVTVPVRIVIVVAFSFLFLFNKNKLNFPKELYWFLLFSTIYITRIFIDYYIDEKYYLSTSEVLFYFLSFAVIPFFSFATFQLNDRYLSIIFKSIILSGTIFSVFSLLSYRSFIGNVGRLTTSSAGEDVISPLILSYGSSLIIGMVTFYLLYNVTTKTIKMLGAFLIFISAVPFFLGASRGSLIALILPFLILFLSKRSVSSVFKNSALFFFIMLVGLLFEEFLGSGLVSRFDGLFEIAGGNDSSESRLDLWKSSIEQFFNHPFFGDKLRLENSNSYPHNIFLEIFQTMGIVGMIPFVVIISRAFKIAIDIFRYFPCYSWIAVFFLQTFSKQLFSGAIYNASWFWLSLALIVSFNQYSLILRKTHA